MKKFNIITGVLCGVLFVGCNDMYEITDEFTNEGELTYLEKPLVETILAGYERVQITINPISDPKVTKCCIYWNERLDSLEVDFNATSDTLKQIIPLTENSYVFNLVNKGSNPSVTSLITTVASKVYGPDYKSSLSNLTLISQNKKGSSVELRFSSKEGCAYTEISYSSTDGESKVTRMNGSTSSCLITDYVPGSEFTYQSFFFPESNSIDIVPVEKKGTANFPR